MNELESLASSPIAKQLLGLKMALCQHPMYLVIDEDRGEPALGERVPPWGAPDAAAYVERVERNLNSLDTYADLRLNYEFSAVEIEAIAERFPAAVHRMAEKFRQKKLDFIGGTFSQPHLQLMGSESNYRQFVFGLEVFQRLFGKKVKVYFTQETGMHRQLPQLLKLFGFDFLIPSPFSWAMQFIGGDFEFTANFKGLSTCATDEFVEAVSLDGTVLPAHMKVRDGKMCGAAEYGLLDEIVTDMPRSPQLWTYFPDMIDMDEARHAYFAAKYDFVLLEETLRQRLAAAPPRAQATMYSYWSYCEGVWAEELLRANKRSEERVLMAESALALARITDQSDELHQAWRTILKYQHHDVHWIEVTDLRRKAIDTLAHTDTQLAQLLDHATGRMVENDGHSVAIFNSLPHKRRALVELAPTLTPSGKTSFQLHKGKAVGFVDLPSAGFASFPAGVPAAQPAESVNALRTFKAKAYSVEFTKDGLMATVRNSRGKAILKADEFAGGEIRALIDDRWVDNRDAECSWLDGPVALVVERRGKLGTIPLVQRFLYFKQEPLVKTELEFDFSGDKVGYFWLDETKINVYYPATAKEVWHDIPFGYVQSGEARTILATNWVACGGLVLVNRGTPKHWVKNRVLANMLGWGGNSFSNRLHHDWPVKNQYDIRLYGKQTITHFLLPMDRFDGNTIVRAVEDYTFPVWPRAGSGKTSLLKIRDKTLAVTALYDKNGQLRVRGYQLPCRGKGRFRDWEIFDLPAKRLAND